MLAFQINNVKNFMSQLLKNNVFDSFEVRNISLQTFTNFEINGILNKEFYTLDEQEELHRDYCLWSELKPYVFLLIKGNKLPKSIKLVFSLPKKDMSEINENAASMFLNIAFEHGEIMCTTGTSQKTFSIEKAVDYSWEEYITLFMNNNQIQFTKLS